jgi:hypothetical protein
MTTKVLIAAAVGHNAEHRLQPALRSQCQDCSLHPVSAATIAAARNVHDINIIALPINITTDTWIEVRSSTSCVTATVFGLAIHLVWVAIDVLHVFILTRP